MTDLMLYGITSACDNQGTKVMPKEGWNDHWPFLFYLLQVNVGIFLAKNTRAFFFFSSKEHREHNSRLATIIW